MRNDMRQSGLAQARRAVEQSMVEGLATLSSGLHKDAQVVDDLLLSGKAAEGVGTQDVFLIHVL